MNCISFQKANFSLYANYVWDHPASRTFSDWIVPSNKCQCLAQNNAGVALCGSDTAIGELFSFS